MDKFSNRVENGEQPNTATALNEAFQKDSNIPMPKPGMSSDSQSNRQPSTPAMGLMTPEMNIFPAKDVLAKLFGGTADGDRLFNKIDTAGNFLPFTSGDRAISKDEIERVSKLPTFRGANKTSDVEAAKTILANWDKPAFQEFKNGDGEITKQSYERAMRRYNSMLESTPATKMLEKAQNRLDELGALDDTLAPATRIINGSVRGRNVLAEMEGSVPGSGLSKQLVKHIAESNPNNPFSYSNDARIVAKALYKAWDNPDFQALKTGNGIVTDHSFFRGLTENRQQTENARNNRDRLNKFVAESQMADLQRQIKEQRLSAARPPEAPAEPKPVPKPVETPIEPKPVPKPVETLAEPKRTTPKATDTQRENDNPKISVNPTEASAPKLGADLGKAAMVRRGEGPYQVAERILGMGGTKPDHKSIMELTRAFQNQYKDEQGKHARWNDLKVNHRFLTNENLSKVIEKLPNTQTKAKLQMLVGKGK